jgi:hypothetical protein
MKPQTVILDANILFPAPLRDFFMHLAILGAMQARWTKQIEDEWTRNLIAKRPDLDPTRVYRTAAQMNAAILDALLTDFESFELNLVLYGFRLFPSYSLREYCVHHGIRSCSYALWADKFPGEFIGIHITRLE